MIEFVPSVYDIQVHVFNKKKKNVIFLFYIK